MSDRLLRLIIGADNRRLKRDFRQATRDAKRFGRDAGAAIRGGFAAATGGLGALASIQGLADVGRRVVTMREEFTRMGIQAKRSEAEMAVHGKTITALGLKYGLGRQAVQQATDAIVNLQGAGALNAATMELMAKSMAATGGRAQDVAKVVSALRDAGITGKDAEEAMSAFIEAGAQGSIPFAKMGAVLAGLLPKYQGIVQSGKQGAAELGAMLQIMGKVTAGNEGEARTLLRAMLAALKNKRQQLKKEGYGDLFDKDGTLRNLEAIRPVLARLAEDKDIGTLLGREEAATAIQAMATYSKDYESIVAAAAKSNAVNADSMKFLASEAGRMRVAMADVQARLEGLFTPERLSMLTRGAEMGAAAVGLIVDNLDRVFLLVGAIKAMQFGTTISKWANSLSQVISQSTSANVATKVLGGTFAKAAAGLGAVSMAAGVLTAAFTATSAALQAAGYDEWLNKMFDVSGSTTESEEDKRLAKKLGWQRERHDLMIDKIAGGGMRSERVTAAARRVKALRDAGKSDAEILRAAPADYALLRRAGQGRIMSPDQLAMNANQLALYQGKVRRREATAENRRLMESLNRQNLGSFLNQTLAKDADQFFTPEEIERAVKQRFRYQAVQQPGQTPEQAEAFAAAKNKEIARMVWSMLQEQAREYGERYTVKPDEIVLRVDGNELARVSANARDNRRSEAE